MPNIVREITFTNATSNISLNDFKSTSVDRANKSTPKLLITMKIPIKVEI